MSIEQTFEKWSRDASQTYEGGDVSVFGWFSSFSSETQLKEFRLHDTGSVDIIPYDGLLRTGIPAIMKDAPAVLPFILPGNIGVAWIGSQHSMLPSTVFLEFILHSAITPIVSTAIFSRPELGTIRDDIYDLVCDSGRWGSTEEAKKGVVASISPKIYNLVQASSSVPLESLMTADLF